MSPILSIIILVFNLERYLKDTLLSITTQRLFKECEIVLINDGSTDKSWSIIKDFSARYSNIISLNRENKGVSATRNEAIVLSKGIYITFMDSDDLIHPDYLLYNLRYLKNNECDILAWSYSSFYSRPKFFKTQNNTDTILKDIYNDDVVKTFNYLMNKGVAVSPCTKAIKKSLLLDIQFNTNATYGEDLFFSWKCILSAKHILYLDIPLYYYRQTITSATSRFHKNLYEVYRASFRDLIEFADSKGVFSNELSKDIDYHFARRIPALTAMEARAPYGRETQEQHLTMVLNDEYICRALECDDRLTGKIYNLARQKKVKKMLAMARRDALKAKLLFPLKKLLK